MSVRGSIIILITYLWLFVVFILSTELKLNLDMFFASRFALAGHPEEAQAKRVLKQ